MNWGSQHGGEYLRDSKACVWACIADDGTLVDGNAGFLRLLDEIEPRPTLPALNVTSAFVQPGFRQLTELADAQVYRGRLSIGWRDGRVRGLIGQFERVAGAFHLFAEFDVEELDQIQSQVIDLNTELTATHRALAHANRSLEHGISERTADLKYLAQRAEALLALGQAAEGKDETSFMQHALRVAEQLTGSSISFIHFVHQDQQSIELVTWSQATLSGFCKASFDQHYPVSQAGIWADALRQRAPVVYNEYASAGGKRGLPEGHAHLERLISVPVLDAGLVSLLMGVGNKAQPYGELDVETTRLVAEAIWRIAQQRRSNRELELRLQRHQAMLDTAMDGYWLLDTQGRLVEVNRTYCSMSGYSLDELLHMGIADLDAVEGAAEASAHVEKIMRFGQDRFESKHRRKDGSLFDVEASVQFQAIDGGCLVVFLRDITEHKAAEARIESLAFSDSLTGLANRQLLMDRLQLALVAGRRHHRCGAVLLIDLDEFKTFNDSQGHHQGDLLLCQVARRLLGCVREDDTVARFGGDEFVVLLGDLSEEMAEAATQARQVGQKIITALNQIYLIGESRHRSTPSIGITLLGDDAQTAVDPMVRADLAMYQAKAAGGNQLRFFDPLMQLEMTKRAALEAELRDAIPNGELLLYYQAQITDAHQIIGAEALVRWLHPQRGLLAPGEFIAIAEKSGLILPLGQWVLDVACRQLTHWASQPEMAGIVLAVNVSAQQFAENDFVQQVLATLERTGARADRLKLELTESVVVQNIEEVIAKMKALKARGIGFSMDDFGTGYSSLSYIKRLPLDQLKIDQAFVRNILVDTNDAAIAQMVIVLARSLGLQVIAEGVETRAQLDLLSRLECHCYQGYLWGRLVPVQAFEALVRAL